MNRRAFSLAEVMIATGILGVGLIMVASVFPVAIAQHRESTEIAGAASLAQRTRALIQSRINTDDVNLWRPLNRSLNTGMPDGQPMPWLAIPVSNLNYDLSDSVLGTYDLYDQQPPPVGLANIRAIYENMLSTPIPGSPAPAGNPHFFLGYDLVTDLRPPSNGIESDDLDSRLYCVPFYREPDASHVVFAGAVCRQLRGQQFLLQDPTGAAPFATPTILASTLSKRFPVPWRVTAFRDGSFGAASRILSNDAPLLGGGLPLGLLAPVGAQIMLTGFTNQTYPGVPVGRVLTVVEVGTNPRQVEVAENISDILPGAPPLDTVFDLWIIPPESPDGASFGPKSPVVEWFFF